MIVPERPCWARPTVPRKVPRRDGYSGDFADIAVGYPDITDRRVLDRDIPYHQCAARGDLGRA
jgi:hypothetical protein